MLLKSLFAPLLMASTAFASPMPKGGGRDATYYALELPTKDIRSAVASAFASQPANVAAFYNQLKNDGRVQNTFHVTLIHSADKRGNEDVWSYYSNGKHNGETANVQLKTILWNDELMAVSVQVAGEDGELPSADKHMHITIGTADSSIKPVQSNDLLETWSTTGAASISSLDFEDGVSTTGTIRGF